MNIIKFHLYKLRTHLKVQWILPIISVEDLPSICHWLSIPWPRFLCQWDQWQINSTGPIVSALGVHWVSGVYLLAHCLAGLLRARHANIVWICKDERLKSIDTGFTCIHTTIHPFIQVQVTVAASFFPATSSMSFWGILRLLHSAMHKHGKQRFWTQIQTLKRSR